MKAEYAPIYPALLKAGATMDNHESDLYVLIDDISRPILDQHSPMGATKFRSELDGKLWMDIPFAYLPYWERKEEK